KRAGVHYDLLQHALNLVIKTDFADRLSQIRLRRLLVTVARGDSGLNEPHIPLNRVQDNRLDERWCSILWPRTAIELSKVGSIFQGRSRRLLLLNAQRVVQTSPKLLQIRVRHRALLMG